MFDIFRKYGNTAHKYAFGPIINPNRIGLFDSLYERKDNPVSITPCPSELKSLVNVSDFKQAVQNVFGFSSTKLVSLISERLAIPVDVDEYVEDVPQPAHLKSVRRKIIKLDGNPAYAVAPQNTSAMFVTGYEPTTRVLEKKKEYHIDYSLFLKGLYVKGLFTVDHLHTMVETHRPYYAEAMSAGDFSAQQLRDFFSFFTPKKILKIMGDPKFLTNKNLIIDSVRQYSAYNQRGCTIPDDWKDLQELHDGISKQVAIIKKADKGKPFAYTEFEKKLDGYKITDRLTLALPFDAAQLGSWAMTLHNCAASYDERIMDKKTLLVGVLKREEIFYLLEIRFNTAQELGYYGDAPAESVNGWRIGQFVESCNKPPKSQEDSTFVNRAIELWNADKLPQGFIGEHQEETQVAG